MTHDELIDALSRTSARHELITLVSQAVKERDEAISHLVAVLSNPYSRSAEKTKALIDAQDWVRNKGKVAE